MTYKTESNVLNTDVLVIGTGFAGLSAAIEAHLNGAKVLVIEKMKAVGGNSIICDGGVAAPCTDLQDLHKIKDSKELMYNDMMKAGLGLNDEELVRTFVNEAKDAFYWSREYLGVEYLNRIDLFGGHSTHRCYTADGISGLPIIRKLMEKIKELNIEILLSTSFNRFIVNKDQKVLGIYATTGYDIMDESKGSDVLIYANKGVIVASGGYGADVDFRKQYDLRLDEKLTTTNKRNGKAEVLQAMIDLGANPIHLDQIQLGPWASPDEHGYGVGPMFSEYIVFQYGVIIDPSTGKRYINELVDRKQLSDHMLQLKHPSIGIADTYALQVSGWDIAKAIKKGVVKSFDTLEELAIYYDLPIKSLQETIDQFNRDIANGADTAFKKPILKKAKPILHPPYYSMRLWPKVHYTMGGIQINKYAQVINTHNQVIPNLYAAGEVTGGLHGASRLGSCSITECFVFGRIAGTLAATN